MPGKVYAFVNYGDYQAAQSAIVAMDGMHLGDKILHVAFKSERKPI